MAPVLPPAPFVQTAFTPDQQKQIQDALARFNPVCPVCHSEQWFYADYVDIAVTALPGRTLPVLPLICRICGNTQFINLKILGITEFLIPPLPQS